MAVRAGCDVQIQLHALDTTSDSFLVLACDGVWDAMTSEDVVKYVPGRVFVPWLGARGLRPVTVPVAARRFVAADGGPRETVAARLAQEVLDREVRCPPCRRWLVARAPGRAAPTPHVPVMQADNSNMTLQQLLQLPPGRRRSFHDDITVVVLYFNQDAPKKAKGWLW